MRALLLNAIIGILSIAFSLWGILLSFFDRSGGRLVHYYCASVWGRIILWVCGVNVRVDGLVNVEREIPRIYMSNHQSFFDIFILLAYLPVDFKFILKAELTRIPFLGSAMKRAGYVSIDRTNPRKALKSMNEAAQRITSGASVLIFPEGTRSEDGLLQAFKPGGFHLSIKSGCAIVPIAINNSRAIAPKGSLKITPGSVTMIIGKPIPVNTYSRKEMEQLMDQVWTAIDSQMDRGSTA